MRKTTQLGVGAASLGILAGLVVLPVATPTPAVAAAADPPPTLTLSATVRDFDHCSAVNAEDCHPDFETFSGTDKSIVLPLIGEDGKPVYANPAGTTPTTTGRANFDQWYRDVPGVNIAVPLELTAVLVAGSDPPTYRYEDSTYFPVDGRGWNDPSFGNAGQVDGPHNFSFTTEIHTTFVYRGGEEFSFIGDDDVFLFINGRLAINLGGVHGPQADSVNLDGRAEQLDLEIGETYSFDLFGAERHTTASNFTFETSLALGAVPEVAVTGVEDGADYELGAVPTPGCAATDAAGDPVTPDPTPSVGAVTGELAAYGLGSQTVTCTYEEAVASATYDIVTTQPPTLPAIDDVLVEVGPGETTATDTYELPAATDPHGLPVSVVCTPLPTATFPLGPTPVSCVATNVAGLPSTPQGFTVTVRQREAEATVLILERVVAGRLAARLTTADGTPVSGKTVTFVARNRLVCTAVTDADGRATCNGVGGVGAGLTFHTATFAGDAAFLPSSATGGLGSGGQRTGGNIAPESGAFQPQVRR